MRKHFAAPLFAAIISSLLPLGATPAVSQTKAIGLATQVQSQVSGIISGQQRAVTQGSEVYQLEIIRTMPNSKAQLAFLDSTVLSVGPMSEVNLDSFVFDPNRNAGDVAVQMGRGTFRFITGSQEKRNYKVITPFATIGVRGTIFHVQCDGDTCTIVLQEGAIILTLLNGMQVAIDQPGFGVVVDMNGVVQGPRRFDTALEDPFGAGWLQFADNGLPQTTGATTPAFGSPLVTVNFVNPTDVVPPCLTPSCN